MIHMYIFFFNHIILNNIISYYIMLYYIEHPQVLPRHDPARISPPRDLFLGHSDALLSDLCRSKGQRIAGMDIESVFFRANCFRLWISQLVQQDFCKKNHGRLCIVKTKTYKK